MLLAKDAHGDPSQRMFVKLVKRWFPVTTNYHGQRFLVRSPVAGRGTALSLTPLALAPVMVEGADLVFAIYPIPASFAIPGSPFLFCTPSLIQIWRCRPIERCT